MRLEIRENKIINLDEIKSFVNKTDNVFELREFLINIKDFDKVYEEIKEIKRVIILKTLIEKPKGYIEISENECLRLIKTLFTTGKITKRETKDLHIYIENILDKYEREVITKVESDLLEMYMFYLKDINTKPIKGEKIYIMRYDDKIYAEEKKLKEQKIKEEAKQKKLSKENSSKGIVTSALILEATIILGMILSLLLLAKR